MVFQIELLKITFSFKIPTFLGILLFLNFERIILILILETHIKKIKVAVAHTYINKKIRIIILFVYPPKKYHKNLLKFQKNNKNAFNFLHFLDFNIVSNLQILTESLEKSLYNAEYCCLSNCILNFLNFFKLIFAFLASFSG